MADGLHPVAVGIEHEGGEVVSVILWPKTRLTVALAARVNGRPVKCLNRRSAMNSREYQSLVAATMSHKPAACSCLRPEKPAVVSIELRSFALKEFNP